MRFPRTDSSTACPVLSTPEGRAAWHAASRNKRVRLLFDHAMGHLDLAILDGRDRSIRAAVRFLHECQTQLDRLEAEDTEQDRAERIERDAMFELLQEREDIYQDFLRRCERLEALQKNAA